MLVRLLRRHLRPYTGLLLCVLVLQFAQVMASLYLPTLNADIIDKGVATGDTGYIWRMGAFMLVVSVGQGVCSVAATYLAARSAMSMGRDLRGEVFERVSGFSEREITAFGAGSLITRNTNDVQQVQMLVMMGCTMLVTAPVMAVGGIIMAITRAPSLSWLIGVSVPVLLVAVGLIVGRMLPLFRSYQDKLDAINRVMREQLTGIRVIRAFVREQAETERFEDANTDIARVGERVGQLFVLLFPLVMLVLDVTIVGVIWFGGHQVGDGDVEVGTLIAFMSYLMQILMGIVMASFMTIMIPRAAVCAERISEVLATAPTITSSPDAVDTFPAPGTVEMRDVTFVYPDADARVLAEVSFTVQPGTTTAIVGSTASGKSTVVRLLSRLLEASSGQVLIGGTDVREADPEALWAQMGLVPQQPFLFAGTVASNLRLGREEATDDELWKALEVAQAKDFVSAMDGGLEAAIAQGGTNVSGGQRQRLAIARALVRRPDILIFDDSFSALDVSTDARLREAMGPATAGITKVIVAQRVSTITEADQILVLDGGHLVGSGTHTELLATCPVYREIVTSQLGAEAAA
ncbi:ABC transporter ATP-binding protein [Actinomyces naeslundii]|uniref:ABC transporter transmembrane region n=2 Tax=Actinomyces naeslundii TaxID=1655 RepID=J3F1S2_ACTNH|nr:ABC transporter ATP-binding protein [Actinomyces naeslundii]EJN84077.1 ABC transporter transmembrane region [Actinomyces naeslundii str. Howell 279]OMG31951.1 multidrug ABC transporter ATP-binding protein [Actinomyces naeslundii]OMG37294.1 multidrug ABC transporter ATP-binding protein [Actinomyces naeslundii]QQC19829.1 ABC transporter ATP-binding protein [Actinomyces naeslundii]